ncbi:MAG TPA: methyltransferase [Acidimicrobiales bacterium]|nr:methyltransferase [Acidimicrobiales bacterium]
MAGHYFDPQPASAERRGTVHLHLADLDLDLATGTGVFAGHEVDRGTLVLLRHIPAPPTGDLLDLGCGYGPIAVTLAARSPDAKVWAVDVNERALALAAENAAAAGLENLTVARPDEIPADTMFSAIYSNPPIRIGKPALHELLTRWLGRLGADGRAWLVVQKHLGSDSLQRWLEETGHPTTRVAADKGYRLLEVQQR